MLGGSDSARPRDDGAGLSRMRTECPQALSRRPAAEPAGPPPRMMTSNRSRSPTGMAVSLVLAVDGIQSCLSGTSTAHDTSATPADGELGFYDVLL